MNGVHFFKREANVLALLTAISCAPEAHRVGPGSPQPPRAEAPLSASALRSPETEVIADEEARRRIARSQNGAFLFTSTVPSRPYKVLGQISVDRPGIPGLPMSGQARPSSQLRDAMQDSAIEKYGVGRVNAIIDVKSWTDEDGNEHATGTAVRLE